jgi:hypothetical protein
VVITGAFKRRFKINRLFDAALCFLYVTPMHEISKKVTKYGFRVDRYFFPLPRNAGKASQGECAP